MASQRMLVIDKLFNKYMDEKSYDLAIDFLEKQINREPCPYNLAETCVLLEHLSHCYSLKGNTKRAFQTITSSMTKLGLNFEFKFAESQYILGAGLLGVGEVEPGLVALEMALERNDFRPESKEYIDRIVQMYQNTKSKEEADASEKEKPAAELIEDEKKENKKQMKKLRKTKGRKARQKEGEMQCSSFRDVEVLVRDIFMLILDRI